jgi:hypothetical protein
MECVPSPHEKPKARAINEHSRLWIAVFWPYERLASNTISRRNLGSS